MLCPEGTAAVGVPEIDPVFGSKANPAGRVPEFNE
jgi:hypothetical protein